MQERERLHRYLVGERPLGLYVYSGDPQVAEHVLEQTSSGGACVNICALQGALPSLGFGGVGQSGSGRHHGIEGFREFSNPRGVVVRGIQEETGTTIEIEDDGTIKIASVDKAQGEAARKRIEDITADVEVGRIYEGKVVKLMDFGAFVAILPGRDGLVHISQISEERVERVSDKLKEGDVIKVKVLEVDRQGRIRLSMKAINEA